MKIDSVLSLEIPEVKVITFSRFTDERGYFTEVYRKSDFVSHPDIPVKQEFVQVNESHSKKGVLRGLHAQFDPYIGKLVRTVSGHMIDLVMDVRPSSPTFGKLIGHDMKASPTDITAQWIWVPVGFVHGNIFLEETTIEYFCTGQYNPEAEIGINPLDPDIDWSLCKRELKAIFDSQKESAVISPKDRSGISLADWKTDARNEKFKLRE